MESFQEVASWILKNPEFVPDIQKILSALKSSSKTKVYNEEYPASLVEKFTSQGKQEISKNVYLTEQELDTLVALYGEDTVNQKLVNISDWSTNPNPDKSGKPSFLKYRKYVDHYRLIKNSILRDLK